MDHPLTVRTACPQIYAPGATKVVVGDDIPSGDSWLPLTESPQEFFSGALPAPRTAETRVKATLKSGKVRLQ